MSPTVDLNAILTPVVNTVRDTFFPDVVSIESFSEVRDSKGAITGTFATLASGIPAVITRVAQTERGGEVTTNEERLKVLMAGLQTVPLDGRIVRTSRAGVAAADAFDVVGVSSDPASVTTAVTVRLSQPPRVS